MAAELSGEAAGPAHEAPPNMDDPLMAPALARRMACWFYEGMLLFGVVFTAGLALSVAMQMRSGIDPRQWVFKTGLFAVCGWYCTWLWTKGQTLAMRAWDIRVVDRLGRRLTYPR